LRNSDP